MDTFLLLFLFVVGPMRAIRIVASDYYAAAAAAYENSFYAII